MRWIALIAGLIAGLLGGMGLGGGAVLMVYFSLFTETPQLEAQGINLLFFLGIAVPALAVYAFQKKLRFRWIWPTVLGGLAGAACGIWLAHQVGGVWTAKVFGLFLVIAGTKEIFSKTLAKKKELLYNQKE